MGLIKAGLASKRDVQHSIYPKKGTDNSNKKTVGLKKAF